VCVDSHLIVVAFEFRPPGAFRSGCVALAGRQADVLCPSDLRRGPVWHAIVLTNSVSLGADEAEPVNVVALVTSSISHLFRFRFEI
jgi:hypothetical protein